MKPNTEQSEKSLAKEIEKNNNIRKKIIKEGDVKDFLITLNTAESFDDLLRKM
jgi:hypothetical protein